MNDQKIKNLLKIAISYLIYYSGLFFFLNKLLRRKGLIIFNYHNFSTFTNDYWKNGSIFETNYHENFEKQIKFIVKTIGFIKPEYIANQLKGDDLKALLTFDDGYRDNLEIALPILRKYSVSAIFFIPTNFIGNGNFLWHDKIKIWGIENKFSKKKIKKLLNKLSSDKAEFNRYLENIRLINNYENSLMMEWSNIRDIIKNKCKIGAHTKSHIPLNYLTMKDELEEISDSIDILRNKLFQNIELFSVPNGKYSINTQNILKNFHIKYCFSIIPGINDNHVNRYFLRRNAILPSDSIPVVALKILMIKLFK